MGVRARDIPVAKTPPGGWGETMPPPVLAGCDEPLVAGAPDLRGTWRATEVTSDSAPMPADHPLWQHVERIEQAGDRICVTSEGVIHDMRADGTEANGVHDVAAVGGREIHVVATYEDGAHVLRPIGLPGVEVTRRLDGDVLVWTYGPMFTARLRRLDATP
jgi:hypothetical protein